MDKLSFDSRWDSGKQIKMGSYVLEIRAREKPDDSPIAWLFVERRETYLRDGDRPVYSAEIELSYKCVRRARSARFPNAVDKDKFSGRYECGSDGKRSVNLAASTVFLSLPELEGNRIGTYLMNEIVLWAQQWLDATVSPIGLSSVQASDENTARRNWLYEQFNIKFDYSDPEQREGVSRPMLVEELTPAETWKENIRELSIRQCFRDVLSERNTLAMELSRCEQELNRQSDRFDYANAHPFMWIGSRIWWRLRAQAPRVLVIAVLVGVLWHVIKTGIG